MGVSVEAQVTGRVVRVEKNAGDLVAIEDTILVLESMKMEIPVEAPNAGCVREIRVSEGDNVEEGDILAVLD
ncbi:MAG TPA: acetyl-CoA carboxylase biotin carboxyl carrier protein subunit [Myxococcales bacterium]|nr:acetyl-CoA carboxylase biotin carboxyl carrier protein subunit [Myxococcales bacterium]HIL99998.1 acetyl-CoA carboxylase biotin carboxyl carrier protein subunit [Myxococcales bacterium]